MWPAFPTSDYYGGSVPSHDQQPTAGLPATGLDSRRGGRSQDGSHVHHQPVDGVGAQLFPGSLATGTPQTFPVASWPASSTGVRVALPRCWSGVRCCPAPIRQISSRLLSCGVPPLVPARRTPSRLACRARAVWQYRPVPSLSGLLPPSSAPPGSGCPQLHRAAATAQRWAFHPTRSMAPRGARGRRETPHYEPHRRGHDGAESWHASRPARHIAGRAGYCSWLRVSLVLLVAAQPGGEPRAGGSLELADGELGTRLTVPFRAVPA
jgi:hypothetical protein